MESLLNLCPVAGWTLAPIKALDSVAIKLDFLPRFLPQSGDAEETPRYVLTVDQASELATTIERTVQALKLAEGLAGKKSDD